MSIVYNLDTLNNTEELDMNENHDYNLRSKICYIMTKVNYL